MSKVKSNSPPPPTNQDEDADLFPELEKPLAGRILSDGTWMPSIGYPDDPSHPFNKQLEIYNCRDRILLVSGSRLAGKTAAVLQKVCRHLFETPGGRVAVFAKTKGLAKDCGTWQELIEMAVPEWVAGGIGFEITTFTRDGKPGTKLDPLTKSAYFRVKNFYGGESECRLFSIDNDNEIGAKLKGKTFSMIYFMELSTFKDPAILAHTLLNLRMRHLRPKNGEPDLYHQWIGDTNPDEDEGSDSWIYEHFYTKRRDVIAGRVPIEDKDKESMYNSMRIIEMFHWDNPFITNQERCILEDASKLKPGLMDSHFNGIWGPGAKSKTRHFADVFIKDFHVVGTSDDSASNQILVHKLSTVLFAGWDIGKVNHGAAILDKWIARVNGKEVTCWSVLAELLVLQEKIFLKDFTQDFQKLMSDIEVRNGKKYQWYHWSDDTANNVWNPSAGTFDADEVREASDGKIVLNSAIKGEGSIKTRVQILRKLLIENRIYVSACCPAIIKMLDNCRKGSSAAEYVARDDNHKHIFDALTYPIFMEASGELELGGSRPSAEKKKEPQLVSV